MAEEYTLECTSLFRNSTTQSGCQGGIVDHALEMIRNVGLPNETIYPYAASTFTNSGFPNTISSCSSTSGFNVIRTVNNTVPSVTAIRNASQSTIQSLLDNATVVALINADSGFLSYTGGIYSGCPDFDTSFTAINHAVLIVGYDADGWIIKNSWGTTWG